MKCKICGGEILFQNGLCLCESCGSTTSLESIYEKVDLYICYEESDAAGRRTKDSIVAQEIYRKLEEGKIATFYERVSAGGLVGDDLDTGKLVAIHRAKIILVLGSSVAKFKSIEEKYGEHFAGKTIIPFCVDVNPGAIPKTLSKIQAISYSTIGWDKDLIKGVYNILGWEQNVDTGSLYGQRRTNMILWGVIAALICTVIVVSLLFLFKPAGNEDTEQTIATTRVLTAKEIYDKAAALLEQDQYVDALNLFFQIPDHPNSKNMIKQIYTKYEGYYQNESVMVHLEIVDNIRAEIELRVVSEETVTMVAASSQMVVAVVECNYVDNHNKTGTVIIQLDNKGISMKQNDASGAQIATAFWGLAEKTDRPDVQIDSETLFGWLSGKKTTRQIEELGYRLISEETFDRAGLDRLYRIEYTDICLSVLCWAFDGEKEVVCSIYAPAKIIAPSLIGEKAVPVLKDNVVYWPGASMGNRIDTDRWFPVANVEGMITENTMIGVTTKKVFSDISYGNGSEWDTLMMEIGLAKAELSAREKYKTKKEQWVSVEMAAENTKHMLIVVKTEKLRDAGMCAWYRVDKKNHKATFVREGPYEEVDYKISESLWFAEYIDFAKEFLGLYGAPVEATAEEDDVFEETNKEDEQSLSGELLVN